MGKLISKRDAIIILAVLALAAVALGVSLLFAAEPAEAVVYLNGEEYARAALGVERTIVVEQADGSRNEIVIDGDGVHMGASTCENQLCVHQGTISPKRLDAVLGNWIICLPNGVSVELAGVVE